MKRVIAQMKHEPNNVCAHAYACTALHVRGGRCTSDYSQLRFLGLRWPRYPLDR